MTTYQLSARERQLLLLTETAVATLSTAVAVLEASSPNSSPPRERKPIPPELKTLLAKAGLTERAEKGALTVAEVDKSLDAAGVKGPAAITAKLNLTRAGLLLHGRSK